MDSYMDSDWIQNGFIHRFIRAVRIDSYMDSDRFRRKLLGLLAGIIYIYYILHTNARTFPYI